MVLVQPVQVTIPPAQIQPLEDPHKPPDEVTAQVKPLPHGLPLLLTKQHG